VTILGEQYEHKTMSQNPDPVLLAAYLKRNFPGGNYHSVHEAGFSGFESCRKLNQLGVNCIVIHPADMPTSQKEKLTPGVYLVKLKSGNTFEFTKIVKK